jgi:hypothetical protein
MEALRAAGAEVLTHASGVQPDEQGHVEDEERERDGVGKPPDPGLIGNRDNDGQQHSSRKLPLQPDERFPG